MAQCRVRTKKGRCKASALKGQAKCVFHTKGTMYRRKNRK